ncbi:GAF domain-containing protein [Nitratireductor kimnyeongensis]|uniref:GAF domain-containing protein n=1 Tax=Nitratireductor kimnyeongensis TaxID=430679 RepID=A0ABW0T980_9HYPH|nr:GAF domain-containing protein [Nitratireductor kimnyeongensis]QZZ36202.1 GAF domain-containing protein [Nitratireductor kimnyeongensis]
MTTTWLPEIRNALEGIVPSILATADVDGIPNVSLISHVQYVDPDHVALSYQFFNKTRRNLLATRLASVTVVDSDTNAQYRLTLEYLETQTSGPLFEIMRAKLAGIASHSGMQDVFRLLGSDIFRVREIEPVASEVIARPMKRNALAAARRSSEQFLRASDMGELFDTLLACLQQHFGIEHAMVLMLDQVSSRLYTVSSRGYPFSGIGSEIGLGDGVIGVAAAQRVPIRIGHMTSQYTYRAAVLDSARAAGLEWTCANAIAFPGLEAPQSQIAVPILCEDQTMGVLFAESTEPNQFGYDEEDALTLIAELVSARVALLQKEETAERAHSVLPGTGAAGKAIRLRHYRVDNSIFVDDVYIIRGVAGAIFWKLAREHAQSGRVAFTNRELRLDPALRLPDYIDNLEARLLLLQRRLSEREVGIVIDKCGRGRFRFLVEGKLSLEET